MSFKKSETAFSSNIKRILVIFNIKFDILINIYKYVNSVIYIYVS